MRGEVSRRREDGHLAVVWEDPVVAVLPAEAHHLQAMIVDAVELLGISQGINQVKASLSSISQPNE